MTSNDYWRKNINEESKPNTKKKYNGDSPLISDLSEKYMQLLRFRLYSRDVLRVKKFVLFTCKKIKYKKQAFLCSVKFRTKKFATNAQFRMC